MRSIFKLAILVIVLSPMLGFAQGVRYPNTVFATGGFPNAQVTVCTEPATDIAGGGCTPLATVYQDPGLAVPYAQPFSTDANGNFSFYAPPSTVGVPSTQYHAQISGLGLITYDIPYIFIPGGGGGSGGVSAVGLSMPSGFGVANSPITSAGTFVVTMPTSWATGALLYGTGANSVGTLAVGSNGMFLGISGGLPAWLTPPVSSGTLGQVAYYSGTNTLSGQPLLTLNSGLTAVVVTGNETVSGTLGVTGATTLTALLTANGGISTTTIGATAVTATGITDSALTSGNCVQAGAGGVLTTIAGACGIGGGIGGSGTAGFLPEFATGTTLGNSPLRDDGAIDSSETFEANAAGGRLPVSAASFNGYSNYTSSFNCGIGGGTNTFTSLPSCYSIIDSLNVNAAASGVTAAIYGTNSGGSGGLSSTPALAGIYGVSVSNTNGSPNFVTGIAGVGNSVRGTGAVANLTGVSGIALVGNGTGSTSTSLMAGIDGQVQNHNSAGAGGAEPFGAAIYARSPSFQSGAIISNVYGVYIADQTVGGGTSNPNPSGLYEAGTAPNYLGGSLTLGSITGATQCLQVNSSGVIGGTGSACGSGGGGGGNVSGPGSSISGDVVLWNNTTGTLVKDATFGFPLANTNLANSTIGIAGTSNQITSSTATPALGGSTTLAIANPFIFPGKATGAASTTSAATFNIPTGSAPSAPASGDFWNLSGILQFYDGTHTNSLATVQTAPTSGHCVEFSGTAGLLIDAGAACGSGSGSSALSSITAATTTNSINSGNNAQTWNWSLTGATTVGMTFTENSASTGGTPGVQALIGISPLAGSTAVPLILANSLTGSQALPTLSIAPTWNTTGVVDAALLINATNTASGTGSLLADLQINGVSQWSTDKTGTTTQKGSIKIVNDGVHASQVQLVGNTTLWPLGSNEFSLSGPNVASFTSWGIQMPSVGPSVASVLGVGALSSQWSQASLIAIQGTDAKLLSSGTISGSAGIGLCTDANGGATTSGCSPAISLPWSGLTNPTTNLSLSMGINTTLWTVGDYGASPSTAFGITDTATSSTDTTTNFAVNTGTSSRHGSVLFQSSSVNVFQILSTASGAGNWQSISGNCASTPAVTGDYAMMIGCTQAAAPVVDRVFANSAAFTGVVVQAQTETTSGAGFKLFDGRVGCSASGTCASGTDEFYVLGNGTIFSNALILGQCFTAGSTGLISSKPCFDTTQVPGATGEFSHDMMACQAELTAIGQMGGTCDGSGEKVTVTTTEAMTFSGSNIHYIFPPNILIGLGVGFGITVSGNNNTFDCGGGAWSCSLNASAYGGTNAILVTGNGNAIQDLAIEGGRCGSSPCTTSTAAGPGNAENEITISGGNSNRIIHNLITDSGGIGIQLVNASKNEIRGNQLFRTGLEPIFANTSTVGLSTLSNTYDGNYMEEGNTLCHTTGNIGLSNSSSLTISSFSGTSGTLTFATGTNVLVAGESIVLGAFSSSNISLNGQTVVVLSSGLTTTQFEAVVVGTGYSSGAGIAQGIHDGDTVTNNTVRFQVNGTTFCTNTLNTTGAVGGKEALQSQDGVNHTIFEHNHAFNTQNEGMVIGGRGFVMADNTCDECGQLTPLGGAGCYMTSTSSANVTIGDGVIHDNACTNVGGGVATGYCVSVQDEAATGTTTYLNIDVHDNQCSGGAAGRFSGLRAFRNASDSLSWINVKFHDNQVDPNSVTTQAVYVAGSGSVTGTPLFYGNSGYPTTLQCGSGNIALSGFGTGSTTATFFGNNGNCVFLITTGSTAFAAGPGFVYTYPSVFSANTNAACTSTIAVNSGSSGAVQLVGGGASNSQVLYTVSLATGATFTPAASETFMVSISCSPN